MPLTGQKMLPVLEGPGVPCAPGARGMPESMEICAFLIGRHQLVVPCESGREDVKKFTAELTALKPAAARSLWGARPGGHERKLEDGRAQVAALLRSDSSG